MSGIRRMHLGLTMFVLSFPFEMWQESGHSESWANVTAVLFFGGLALIISAFLGEL